MIEPPMNDNEASDEAVVADAINELTRDLERSVMRAVVILANAPLTNDTMLNDIMFLCRQLMNELGYDPDNPKK